MTLDDLNTVVTANGWGFDKPRAKGVGFEYIYYLQPVGDGDIGLSQKWHCSGLMLVGSIISAKSGINAGLMAI